MAIVLVVGSGLFVASFIRLMRVDLGFDHRGVAAIPLYPRIDLSNEQARNETHARAEALLTAGIERLRAVPGVESAAALSGGLPLTTSWTRYRIEARGRDFRDDDMVDVRQATPGLPARVMRLTLQQGRWLAASDIRGGQPVVVLNDEAARRYLGSEPAVGADVTFQLKTWKVVGVVKGLRLGGPESDVRPEAYIPVAQSQIVDGGVYAATGAVIVIAGLIAAWLPARRAGRVDPLVALRAG